MPSVPTTAAAVLSGALVLAGCHPRPAGPRTAVPLVRFGPERTDLPYDDPRWEDKKALFERINADRAAAGAPPVRYDRRAALVGDTFCLESALAGSWGHWDTEGRAPYLRWGLAGGVDYHAENVFAHSVSSGRIDVPVRRAILDAHEQMMAERPPDDGHRRTILDPWLTHVGIGLATAGGELRMSEEFTRAFFEWIEVPARPVRAGEWASFAGRPPLGWDVGAAEVRYEPPPRPLSLTELRGRGSYAYPPVLLSLRRQLPPGSEYEGGGRGELEVHDGMVRLSFPARDPGHYFVVCYVRRKGAVREVMEPATAAMITALE